MGSKSKIAEWVVGQLPPSHTLVDLFAGGCAVTHAAMLSGKWRNFVANDITDVPKLFKDAIDGKYAGEERWISREDFFMYKDSDPYIRTCWSFGNGGRTYLYSRELEPFKRALHRLCFSKSVKEIRLAWSKAAKEFYALCTKGKALNTSLKSLQSMERLQRLQGMESLQGMERLYISQKDYSEVEIPDGATVYCDPPYKGTGVYGKGKYGHGFSHDEFYDWLRSREYPVYVSEYTMPGDFAEVAGIGKTCSMSPTNNSLKTTERLFVHERWAKRWKWEQMSLFGDEDI